MSSDQSFMISDGIDIAPLLSAFDQFQSSLRIAKSDLEKAGVIQYFEFTYELAWKTLKRILSSRGKPLNSPKPVFREAAAEGLIDQPELWFRFMDDRNETVHAYRKEKAKEIFDNLPLFEKEASKLIEVIKKLK